MVKRNPGMVIYKELNWETLMKMLKDSVKDITVITIILAFSGVFGYGVVFDDLTTTIASALVSITTNKTLLLFLVILFLLLCGMFMETTVIALILTPILLPVMQNVGVDPVVFGMIMMTCVTFGAWRCCWWLSSWCSSRMPCSGCRTWFTAHKKASKACRFKLRVQARLCPAALDKR